jgi:hypothetical protein
MAAICNRDMAGIMAALQELTPIISGQFFLTELGFQWSVVVPGILKYFLQLQ